MHETGFAKEVVSHIKNALISHKSAKTVSVNVSLSPASHVSPDGLRAAIGLMVETEGLKDINVNVRSMVLAVICKSCGNLFKIHKATFRCPRCLSVDIDIEMGKEFIIDSIEIEEP